MCIEGEPTGAHMLIGPQQVGGAGAADPVARAEAAVGIGKAGIHARHRRRPKTAGEWDGP